MRSRLLVGIATSGLLTCVTACIPIPISTTSNPQSAEIVEETRSTGETAKLRFVLFSNKKVVATLSKALTDASTRIRPLDSEVVWRTAFPEWNLGDIPAREFMAEDHRARLVAMGLRIVVVVNSIDSSTAASDKFPLPYLAKSDVSTTLGLTVLDLERSGASEYLTVRTDDTGGMFIVPAFVFVFTHFEVHPDTEKAALVAGANKVVALVTEWVPEGPVGIVVVSEGIGPEIGLGGCSPGPAELREGEQESQQRALAEGNANGPATDDIVAAGGPEAEAQVACATQ